MRRRDVILLAGAMSAAWPFAALAQGTDKTYRVGLLGSLAPFADDSPLAKALVHGLAPFGFAPGKNLAFVSRGALGHVERLRQLVAELVASQVDVIVTMGYPAALAAKRGTTLPVVSSNAGDPVGTGLVASLARPGGNLTGISDVSAELAPKRLELLNDFAPKLRRVAVLWNADDLGMTLRYRALQAGAAALGIRVQPLGVREPDDFKQAFAAMTRELPDAVMMVTDSLTVLNHKPVFDFVAAHRLPAIYEVAFLVHDGGLMSYGPDEGESFGRVAALVGRILHGAKPADLPFEQPTLFRLVINLKTAKSIGFAVPPSLLARADEVVE